MWTAVLKLFLNLPPNRDANSVSLLISVGMLVFLPFTILQKCLLEGFSCRRYLFLAEWIREVTLTILCIYFSWYEGDLWGFLWKASRFCMSLMIDFVNHGWFFSYAVHFVVHIISRNCFSHLAQEVLMSSPIRMESTSIWESSSFANSKSA